MRWSGILVLLLGACADDAMVAPPDAAAAPADAAPVVEDLDLTLAGYNALATFSAVPGRNYRVANPLGHLAEAIAVASSPTGGELPVGTVVIATRAEPMVKRRRGWNPASGDWEFFAAKLAGDGVTATAFTVRGREETACFACHASVSSPTWDYMCNHP